MEAKRLAIPQRLGDVLEPDEAIVERQTGKTLDEWQKIFRERLVSDIEKGVLNPNHWIPADKQAGMCHRYGLIADDLIFARKDDGMYIRLNPDKYGHLSSLFGTKRMRLV